MSAWRSQWRPPQPGILIVEAGVSAVTAVPEEVPREDERGSGRRAHRFCSSGPLHGRGARAVHAHGARKRRQHRERAGSSQTEAYRSLPRSDDSRAAAAAKPRYHAQPRPIFTGLDLRPRGVANVTEPATRSPSRSTSRTSTTGSLTCGVALLNGRGHARGDLPHAVPLDLIRGSRKPNMCHVPNLPLTSDTYHIELVIADGYGFIGRVDRAGPAGGRVRRRAGDGEDPESQPGQRRCCRASGSTRTRRKPASHAMRMACARCHRRRGQRGRSVPDCTRGSNPGHDSRPVLGREEVERASVEAVKRPDDLLSRVKRVRRRRRIDADFAAWALGPPGLSPSATTARSSATRSCATPPRRRHQPSLGRRVSRPRIVLQRRPEGCPLVWRLADMAPCTGGCHYDEGCGAIRSRSALFRSSARPMKTTSRQVWQRKYDALWRHGRRRRHRRLDRPALAWPAAEFPRSRNPNGLDTEDFAPRNKMFARDTLGVRRNTKVRACAPESLLVRKAYSCRRVERTSGTTRSCCSISSTETAMESPVPRINLGRINVDRYLWLHLHAATCSSSRQ